MAASGESSCTTPQFSYQRTRYRCYCGEYVVVRMSWKVVSFGRRFWTCPKMQGEQCKYFNWYDESTCPRGREVGQKVQDKMKKLEDKIDELKLKEKQHEKECDTYRKLVGMLSDELKKKNKRERDFIRVIIMCLVMLLVLVASLVVHVKFPTFRPNLYLPQ